VIIPETAINLFQTFLSRHFPGLNSLGDEGHFWLLGFSKFFETSYLPVSELSPGLTQTMKEVRPKYKTKRADCLLDLPRVIFVLFYHSTE
jgi:hypothetical protein